MGIVSKPVVAKLGKRYDVRQSLAESLETGNVLVPTTNADEVLKTLHIALDPASGVGTSLVSTFTVPAGKRWTLIGWEVERANTGANAVSVADPDTTDITVGSASGTKTGGLLYQPVACREGWQVIVSAGTGTSGDIQNKIFYYEEDFA